MTWDNERVARAALTTVVQPGDSVTARRLLDMTAEEIWHRLLTDVDERWYERARGTDVDQVVAQSEKAMMRFLIPGDEEWPVGLDDLSWVGKSGMGGVPIGLWVLGPTRVNEASERSVAIVGCRAATSYGQDVAMEMAHHLAQGHSDGTGRQVIVSGGAFGIDVAAHRGALCVDETTIGVLACGLDVLYPRGNAAVLERIAETGALVSEMPPGRHPTRPGFLARNRLIAALTTGTVIVEAGWRTSSSVTVRRSWCAMPRMSAGSSENLLLNPKDRKVAVFPRMSWMPRNWPCTRRSRLMDLVGWTSCLRRRECLWLSAQPH